jgi:hypothetical protein
MRHLCLRFQTGDRQTALLSLISFKIASHFATIDRNSETIIDIRRKIAKVNHNLLPTKLKT